MVYGAQQSSARYRETETLPLKINMYIYFVKNNIGKIIIFLIINAIFLILTSRVSTLNQEVILKNHLYQDKTNQALLAQTIRDEITSAININTELSRINLNSMTNDAFNNHSAENRKLTQDYKNNEIDFLDYWNQVLIFYNKAIRSLLNEAVSAQEFIYQINTTSNSLSIIALIYAILLIPANAFISILLSKNWEEARIIYKR